MGRLGVPRLDLRATEGVLTYGDGSSTASASGSGDCSILMTCDSLIDGSGSMVAAGAFGSLRRDLQ